MSNKLALIAFVGIVAPTFACAFERTPETEFRRFAGNASMTYMNCRLDAQASIDAIRQKRAERMTIQPGDSSKITECIAKGKEAVYARVADMNALIVAHKEAAGYIKDWYETQIGAYDRLTVDVANLRDAVDQTTEVGRKLDKAMSVMVPADPRGFEARAR